MGTSLGHGILTALQVLETDAGSTSNADGEPQEAAEPPPPQSISPSAAIVLLTDGENTAPPDPLEAALAAAEKGVRIYTIGIGSPTGTTLEVNGFTVHTQLYEEPLRQIAQLTEGSYYYAGSEQDLQTIYENLTPQWVVKPEKMEITSILAGASLLVLLLGGMFSMLWFNRLP
jgi:Ca-activated chloride channel family protein